ncbi:hypothetical protein F444_03945 [Phytophthora nicotianae P1976]|uniref:Uncharacterized protein n=1 Tax=Phytophthora nicotianae P1976 TaxID=1317066 RepID=A0A081ASF8_PHYNI|nr:hypothetical protein F444_03945 [Phytophthora nicotianae P1976]
MSWAPAQLGGPRLEGPRRRSRKLIDRSLFPTYSPAKVKHDVVTEFRLLLRGTSPEPCNVV